MSKLTISINEEIELQELLLARKEVAEGKVFKGDLRKLAKKFK